MFWRCLHRRALPLAPFILLLNPRYFAADFNLVRRVGGLTCMSYLDEELDDFNRDRQNHRFVRRCLKIRLSGRRICHAVHGVMGHTKFPLSTAATFGATDGQKIPRSGKRPVPITVGRPRSV